MGWKRGRQKEREGFGSFFPFYIHYFLQFTDFVKHILISSFAIYVPRILIAAFIEIQILSL